MRVKKSDARRIPPTHLWTYLRNCKFNSILIRNFVLIILLVVLPNCVLGVYFNIYAKQALQSEISEANMDFLYRSSDMIETVMRELYKFSYNLSVSQNTKQFVFANRRGDIEEGLTSSLYGRVRFYTMTYDYVESIYIYSEKSGLILYNGELDSVGSISDKTWMPTYKAMGDGNFTIQARRKNDYYPYYITLICPIKSANKTVGAIVVNVNIENLGKLIGSNGNVKQELYMLDSSLRLYFCSDYDLMDRSDHAPDKFGFLKNRTGDFSEAMKIDGQETILSCIRSKNYPWSYVFVSPLSVYQNRMDAINGLWLRVTLIYLFLSLAVSYLLTLRSFKPVKEIMEVVENPSPWGDESTPDGRGGDEIRYITSLVRKTQAQNNQMKLELDKRLQKLHNAQLLALQSQIDPHFLYNTLDTINWKAIEITGGENEVSAMISALAQLLRSSLQRSGYLVTVQEEIGHTELYVKILELHYRKLQVHWNIGEEIFDCKIVRLSLQPLVENALIHGLRPKRYQGNIYIDGALVGDTAVLTVEDDGVGMDDTERQNLNDHLKTEYEFDDRHVGIRNVNQRMKILFGDKYGVVIARGHRNAGLAVTLVFPARPESRDLQ